MSTPLGLAMPIAWREWTTFEKLQAKVIKVNARLIVHHSPEIFRQIWHAL